MRTKEEIREMMEDIRVSLLGRHGSLPKIVRALNYMPSEKINEIMRAVNNIKKVMSESIGDVLKGIDK